MKKLKRILLNSAPVKSCVAYLQRKPFPGYNELNWYAVLDFFVRWVDARDMSLRASALSYTFFLALFPSVIFVFTLIAYLPFNSSHEEVLNFFAEILPDNAYVATRSTILDILKNQHGRLLSLGFLTAMYFSTNGFVSLMKAFNRYAKHREKRSFWKQRLVAVLLSIVVSVLLLVAVTMVTLGNYALHALDQYKAFSHIAPVLLVILNYAIVSVLFLTIISTIYYFAPFHGRTRTYKFFTPGSIAACIVILLSTMLFSFYVNAFNSYNKVYGSIGVLIVVMLLIYINTYILLLGYEFNVALERTVAMVRKGTHVKANRIVMVQEVADDENHTDGSSDLT